MKNIERGLVATGVALVLSGGIASAVILSNGAAADAAQPGIGTELAALIGGGGGVTSLAEVNANGRGGADLIAAAATYIGIPVADVRTQLSAGKSLTDIAMANGKTRDGLIASTFRAIPLRLPRPSSAPRPTTSARSCRADRPSRPSRPPRARPVTASLLPS